MRELRRAGAWRSTPGGRSAILGQQQFLDLVERKPGFSISVMRVLSRRLRHMNKMRRAESMPQPASIRVGALELRFDIRRAFWRGLASLRQNSA